MKTFVSSLTNPPESGPGETLEEPRERLESWKTIAAYLGREVRTVQRWEKTEQLPIHRHQHAKFGTVYAYKSELKEWQNSRRISALKEEAVATEMIAPVEPLAAVPIPPPPPHSRFPGD